MKGPPDDLAPPGSNPGSHGGNETAVQRAAGEGLTSCPRTPMPEICMSGSMSGMWKRSYGCASEAPPDERGGKQICPAYRHRATSRLYHEPSSGRDLSNDRA